MAFDKTRLVLIEGAGKLPYYKYETADAAAVVDTAGYFNDAAAILPVGSVIMVISVNDLAAPTAVNLAGHQYVNANDGTTVDVVDLTALSATDTD